MIELKKLVRKNIQKLKPYSSARDKFQEGIFLDANENSFGSVFKSQIKNLNRYPDPHQKELRIALEKFLKIRRENIFFGVGSDEIIDLVIRIFCEPGKSNVIIPEPTYGMYKVACDINDVNVKNCPLDKDFDIDLKTIENLIDHNSRIIFLCSPNNPTGNLLNKEKIKLLAEKFSGIIFIDEAYIDFSDDASFLNYMQQYKNVIVSRTFSKAWGLAGVRCGYCVADEYIINLLFKVKAPYSISRLTANAVINSIKNYQKKNNFIQKLNIEKEKLIGELKRIEFVQKIFPSNANFLLVKLKNASEIYNLLNSKGIRVRIRSDHKRLKNCLRITIGTAKENLMLIKTLKEFDEKK